MGLRRHRHQLNPMDPDGMPRPSLLVGAAFTGFVVTEILACNGWNWLIEHWWPAIMLGTLTGGWTNYQ